MNGKSISQVIAYAIGGGWGSDSPHDGLVPVRVVRGADFPNASICSLEGTPLRYEDEKKVNKRTLQLDDIILEISGGTKGRPTGRTVRVTERLLQGNSETLIPASFCRLVRIDPDRASPKFVYYALQNLYNEGGTWKFQNQPTGIANFQFELFKDQYRLPDIDISQQQVIARALGALDEKIAANDRIRHLVDNFLASTFVRATKNCGWSTLSAIGDVNTAIIRPAKTGELRYVDISAVGQGTFDMPDVTAWEDAPGRARRVLKPGDTIWSTVRPNRRSHALVLDEDPLLVASTGLAVLSPHSRRSASLYEATRTERFTTYLESQAEGSAYPAVRGDKFVDAPIPEMSSEHWDNFESIAFPLRQRVQLAAAESRRLAEARDELLPLLMSGKIRVRDAEKTVEEVV